LTFVYIFVRLDLSGVPRKLNVLALAEFCSEEKERSDLQWLCSKGDVGKQLWNQFIEGQRVGLGELISLFPSCKITLSTLLACCGTLPPRLYSIASSPLSAKDSISIAFSCVRYTCGITSNGVQSQTLNRYGVCTTYLERLVWHRGSIMPKSEKVRIFLKPSVSFRLPGSTSHPLLLIGPGTGVAPFVGFLQHRAILEMEKKKDGVDISTGTWRGGLELGSDDLPHECNNVQKFIHSTPAGDIMLFFGCRDDKDFLYKGELESKVIDKTLTTLEVAKSRAGKEKVYVTHKIIERGAEIAKYILQEGGYIYICGDGNSMAKDVNAAIKLVLTTHGGLTEEEVDETIDEMKLRRKYVLDIWS
jgi:sulfite reductase alpha subunit-like flavoprotein